MAGPFGIDPWLLALVAAGGFAVDTFVEFGMAWTEGGASPSSTSAGTATTRTASYSSDYPSSTSEGRTRRVEIGANAPHDRERMIALRPSTG